MINLNKLFPRLTISAKLAVAFVVVAVTGLAIAGGVGSWSAVRHLRERARSDLERDVEAAYIQTARSLREAEQHVTFLARVGLAELVSGGSAGTMDAQELDHIARTYLEADSSAVFRLKVVDATGRLLLVATREGAAVQPARSGEDEPLYAVVGETLSPGGRAFLPVEFRAVGEEPGVVPAVATVVPVYAEGAYRGVVVGEADAAALFAGLEMASPGLEGVTGLVDEEGRFLYHSERKRDWSSLLASRSEVTLQDDFRPAAVAAILGADGGTISTSDARAVSFRRIPVGHPWSTSITLYRSVPLAALGAAVWSYLRTITVAGLVIVALVLGLSVIAARQITRPIYRLREAAGRIARGEAPGSLAVETNDEIEDLARDFSAMAEALERHRRSLESLVADRTRALAETRAELTQIVTYSADAIVGLDAHSRIRFWNRGAEALFGFSAEDAQGMEVDALIGPEHRNEKEESFIRTRIERSGAVVNYETIRFDCRRRPIPVSMTCTLIRDADGHPVGSSLILRDNRSQEKLQEQMRRSERLAAVSVMAGGLAHELNNPLAILANRVELMQREAVQGNGGDRLKGDLEVLRQHLARISAITTDLLRFARDDADQIAAVDVNAVAERIARLLEKLFVSAELSLELDLAAGLPHVLGNENAVETALVNLLLNARNATPAGGRVRVATRLSADGEYAEIEVSDDGPGVPADHRTRIFEPFFTTRAEEGGTGLGLAVTRAVMDRQGGGIQLRPSRLGGATFVLTLPLNAPTRDD